MNTKYLIVHLAISVLLVVLGGACNSVMDTLQSRYSTSIFAQAKDQQFWNPQLSWQNKWKNGDRAQGDRFFLSSTSLVALTDAWHLFKFGCLVFIFLAMAHGHVYCSTMGSSGAMSRGKKWALFVAVFVLMYLSFTVTFELCYRYAWLSAGPH